MSSGLSYQSALENLRQHPYLTSDPDRYTTCAQGLIQEIDAVAGYQEQVLNLHQQRPIDALVGDDVSARALTLVTSRQMKLAQAGGHIDAVPRTYFMASGRDYGKTDLTKIEVQTWADSLREHAGDLACKASLSNVIVITEQTSTGRAVGRIVDAFAAHGVAASSIEMAITFSSLGGVGGSSQRQAVGVERYRPEPVTRRHPAFDARAAHQLRSFLKDYSNILYAKLFGIDPPTGKLPTPHYTTERQAKRAPHELRGTPYSRKRFGLDGTTV